MKKLDRVRKPFVFPNSDTSYIAEEFRDFPTLGGAGFHRVSDLNNSQEFGQFAVEEHNRQRQQQEKPDLEFVRVFEDYEALVCGMMHRIDLYAKDSGKLKHYRAEVVCKSWVKVEQNKKLYKFTYVEDVFPDLDTAGVKRAREEEELTLGEGIISDVASPAAKK